MHYARPRDGLGLIHIQFHPPKVTPVTNPAKVTDQIENLLPLLRRQGMAQQPSKWSHQQNRSAYSPKWKKADKCTGGTITGPKHFPVALLIPLTSLLRQYSTTIYSTSTKTCCDRFDRNFVNIDKTEPPILTEQSLYREYPYG